MKGGGQMTTSEILQLVGMLLALAGVGAGLYSKMAVLDTTLKDLRDKVCGLLREKDTRIERCAQHTEEIKALFQRMEAVERRVEALG